MIKIIGKTLLKDDEKTTTNLIKGTLDNNIIVYYEEGVTVKIIINEKLLELRRQALEYEIKLVFDLNNITKGIYELLNEQIKLDLDIKTNILEINDNKIILEYELSSSNEEMGLFYYELNYEEIK